MPPQKFTPEQLDELKSRTKISDLLAQFGHKVRGGMCLCPFRAERTPSCQVFEKEGRIHCHGCGQGGDHFDVLKACKGMSFVEAVKYLGGTREISEEDKKRYREQRVQLEKEEREKKAAARSSAQKLFESGRPIQRTQAQAYLRNRGLTVSKRMWADLRFIEKLPYRGFESVRADEPTLLGEYPAMLAAIRDPISLEIIGCHRTYIDRETCLNIVPPGDRTRNKKKKVLGQFQGGLIFLSPPAETLIIGEGIETAESGYEFDLGGPDAAVAAGVNIWNISGSALGTRQNPAFQDDPARRVPDTHPDPEKPGFLPPPWAKRIILLGDGDSEYNWTRAMMATAMARLLTISGIDDVRIAFAPKGHDFNSVWIEEQKKVA